VRSHAERGNEKSGREIGARAQPLSPASQRGLAPVESHSPSENRPDEWSPTWQQGIGPRWRVGLKAWFAEVCLMCRSAAPPEFAAPHPAAARAAPIAVRLTTQRLIAFAATLAVAVSSGTGCHKATSIPPPGRTNLASTSGESAYPPWFDDVTDTVGLKFVHDPGPVGHYFMPQAIGSGGAVFDFDNDGRLDIYLLQNAGPGSHSTNRLFHQGPDGRFTDVSAGSGLDVAGYGMGVAIGDVNNDGWPDVLVTEYGRLRLFLNNGNGTFTDITKEAGLDSPLWGTSASFFDYDRDGWLDLVVVNYVTYDSARWCAASDSQRDFCGPDPFQGMVTKLYRNLGVERGAWSAERGAPNPTLGGLRSALRAPRFKDVTLESGLGRVRGPGLGVFCADFDGDHWPDILVANDGKPNRLWINQHDGTFKEEAVVRGIAYNCLGRTEANMGVAVGDVDCDGLFDVLVTHLTEETNTLWKQGPRGLFQDRTAGAGLTRPSWRGTGWGTVLADFDHDGALDLAVVNGRTKRPRTLEGYPAGSSAGDPFWSPYVERNQLFRNDGNGRFVDLSLSNAAFCGTPRVGRGLICADIDGDGALDLLVTNIAGPARMYRNIAPKRGHWLMVRALDPALHRDAYGAEITVRIGSRRLMRWINPGYSYLCSNDPRAHFGLGWAEHVDAFEVVWPDGTEEGFPGGTVDRVVVLRKGEGRRMEK
jgi:hypothetical protein